VQRKVLQDNAAQLYRIPLQGAPAQLRGIEPVGT
jgi:hypothetical protein